MTELPFLFDPAVVAAVQRLLGLGWPEPWRLVTLLGSNWGILLVLGLSFWLWGRELAYSVLAVVAVDGILKSVLNTVLAVPRPDGAGIVKYERVGVGAFPSGHVSTAGVTWGWLAMRGRIPWLTAIGVVLVVSLSRLYLGVHYVGDVLGGIVLAAVVILATRWLWPPARDWLARRSFPFFAIAALIALAGVTAGTFFYFGGNPYRWRAGGLVAGLVIGLPLEYRFVRYHPATQSVRRKIAMVAIGAAGITAMAAVDLVTGEQADIVGFVSTAVATIWVVLGAPTLFSVLGWSADRGPRREETVRHTARGLGIAAAVVAAIMLYGGAVEPRMMLDTEEVTAEVPGLPPAWEGRTVALLSDLQVGMWLDNTGLMRRAIRDVVREDPSLTIIAGDFIYEAGDDPSSVIGEVMDILEPLARSDIPTFAVLGNHDWGLPRPLGEAEPNREAARLLRDALEAAGIPVLENQAVVVPAPGSRNAPGEQGGDLYLVGVGSHYMQNDDVETAIAQLPAEAPRIAIMHHPQSFPKFPADAAPFAVAGHTHGGQIRLPFTPSWSWLTFIAEEEIHADAWVEEDYGEPGNRLYVTRGVGMSLLPVRINAPPELTLFTLRQASALNRT